MIVLPILAIMGEITVLVSSYETDRYKIYFIWMCSDIALSLAVCINYLMAIERIQQEQNESNDTFERVTVLESINHEEDEKQYPLLSMKQDYYAMTFVTFIDYYKEGYSITPEQ
jgi:hypothetical protein